MCRQEALDDSPLERIDRPDRTVEPQHAPGIVIPQRCVRPGRHAVDLHARELRVRCNAGRLRDRPDRTVAANRAVAQIVPFVGEVKTLERPLPCVATQRRGGSRITDHGSARPRVAGRRRFAAARAGQFSGKRHVHAHAESRSERGRHPPEHDQLARLRTQPRQQVVAPRVGQVDGHYHAVRPRAQRATRNRTRLGRGYGAPKRREDELPACAASSLKRTPIMRSPRGGIWRVGRRVRDRHGRRRKS